MQAQPAPPAAAPASAPHTATAALCAALAIAALPPLTTPLTAQTAARIDADPPSLVLQRGETATLVVQVLDSEGRLVNEAVRIAGARRALSLAGTAAADPGAAGAAEARGAAVAETSGRTETTVTALEVGEWEIIVTTVRPGPGGRPLQLTVPVVVEWPPVVRIEVAADGPALPRAARSPTALPRCTLTGPTGPTRNSSGGRATRPAPRWTEFGHVTGSCRGRCGSRPPSRA